MNRSWVSLKRTTLLLFTFVLCPWPPIGQCLNSACSLNRWVTWRRSFRFMCADTSADRRDEWNSADVWSPLSCLPWNLSGTQITMTLCSAVNTDTDTVCQTLTDLPLLCKIMPTIRSVIHLTTNRVKIILSERFFFPRLRRIYCSKIVLWICGLLPRVTNGLVQLSLRWSCCPRHLWTHLDGASL